MIIRLGYQDKRMDVKELRAHWVEMTGAKQLKIVYVNENRKRDLAQYIADQRQKRKVAGEMAWQDYLDKWRWTTGWLPKGFTKAFGRTWARLSGLPIEYREKAINDWLNAIQVNPDKLKYPPRIVKGKMTGSVLLTSNIKANVV